MRWYDIRCSFKRVLLAVRPWTFRTNVMNGKNWSLDSLSTALFLVSNTVFFVLLLFNTFLTLSINQSINQNVRLSKERKKLIKYNTIDRGIRENTGSYSYIYVLRQYGMKQLRNLVVRVRSLWNGCECLRLLTVSLSRRSGSNDSWRFSAVVASFIARTKLLNVEPG